MSKAKESYGQNSEVKYFLMKKDEIDSLKEFDNLASNVVHFKNEKVDREHFQVSKYNVSLVHLTCV